MRTAIDRLVSWVSSRRHGHRPSDFGGALPPSSCGDEPRNPLLLSAYLDDALSPEERRMVASHLPYCRACRATLAGYTRLADDIRLQGSPTVPYSLDRRIAALATAGNSGAATSAPWARRPALALTAVGLMVAVLLLSGIPFPGSEPPMVAAAYLADDQGEQTFVIRFASPVDQEKVEQSMKVDPPLTVNVEWRGQTMLVKPTERVSEPSNYTVRLQPRGASASETPVSVRFDSREPARALAQQDSGPRQPRPTATAPVAATASIAPAESPSAAVGAGATTPTIPVATPTPAIAVGSKLARVYADRPELASRLGKPTTAESEMEAVTQSFERGMLLRRGDRDDVLSILADGRWRSYPDVPEGTPVATPTSAAGTDTIGRVLKANPPLREELGAAAGQEKRATATLQEFERGVAVWTGDLQIRVLYADGQWQWFADGLSRPATPPFLTPTAAPTAERTPTAAPTLPATASPTPTAPTATVETTSTATETSVPTLVPTLPATAVVTATPPPAATGTAAPTATPSGQKATPVSTPGPAPTAGKKSTPAPTATPR